jgi:hypothetical protein
MKKFVTKHEMYKETRWVSFICNVSGCKFLGSRFRELTRRQGVRLFYQRQIQTSNNVQSVQQIQPLEIVSILNRKWRKNTAGAVVLITRNFLAFFLSKNQLFAYTRPINYRINIFTASYFGCQPPSS